MRKTSFLRLTAIFLAGVSANLVFAAQNGPTDNSGRPLYEAGAIVVKLRVDAAKAVTPAPPGRFGLASLDVIARDLQVENVGPMVLTKASPSHPDLPDLGRILKVRIPETVEPVAAAALFSTDPQVEYAEPIPVMYLDETPDDPSYNQQPFLSQILSEAAWDVHKGEEGAEIVVGISDTGVEWYHEDLAENIKHNLGEDADGDGKVIQLSGSTWIFDPGDENGVDDDDNGYVDDFVGWNFLNDAGGSDNDPDDPDSHGTHVAGLAAAVTDNSVGVASISWNVKILPTSGSNAASGDAISRAYQTVIYLAENGADIINMSWGGPGRSQFGQEVMTYAAGLGSLLVAAAGNDNSAESHYPSAYADVVSIASVGSTDRKASYSNYGISVDVAAPGGAGIVGLRSTIPGGNYGSKSGTSMAAPVTAGLLALVKSLHPGWSNQDLIAQVLATADNIDDLNSNYIDQLGSGRVNALRAVTEDPVDTTPTLRLALEDLGVEDESGDGSLQPGETARISFGLRNYSHLVGSDSVVLTLGTADPVLEVIQPTVTVAVGMDASVTVPATLEVRVLPDTPSGLYELKITADAVGADVVADDTFEIGLMVANGGVLVWEGYEIDTYSGRWMANELEAAGLDVLSISGQFPTGLTGFDAVFLSFGNAGAELSARLDAPWKVEVIKSYLEGGGRLYVEGSDTIGWDILGNLVDGFDLLPLFGIADGDDGDTNEINSLDGQDGALTEGMRFTATAQDPVEWIDIFTLGEGMAAFVESNYGIVAVQHAGVHGQRTFCFSYAIADLTDGATTRADLLETILAFFGILPGEAADRPREGDRRAPAEKTLPKETLNEAESG